MNIRQLLAAGISVAIMGGFGAVPAWAAPGPAVPGTTLAGADQHPTAVSSGGRRSSLLTAPTGMSSANTGPVTSPSTPAPGSAPPNPAKNIPASPAFPVACYYVPASTSCINPLVAALNHARQVIGQPSYSLPANFASMTPAAQLLHLSNADRSQYGLPLVASYNTTLNSIAHTGAFNDTDPSVPDPTPGDVNNRFPIDGHTSAGWAANWAGGYPSAIEAYYEWMYNDGFGSTNIACKAATDPACWGHREDALFNFGSDTMHMGFGAVTNDNLYQWSFAVVYWADNEAGSITYVPVVNGTSPSASPAEGGAVITVSGVGFTGATAVHVGAKAVTPTVISNNQLTFIAPSGTGVQQVTVTGTGGTSGAASAGTVSYLAGRTQGSYVAVTPTRLLDTRTGLGAVKAKIPAHGTVVLTVAGRGGVPVTGASSVMLNVTAVTPTKVGYVTVYPHGIAMPNASNVNYQVGQTTANSAFVLLGADGSLSVTNGSTAPVDVLVDVMGYVVAGVSTAPGAMVPVSPARLLDTRTGLGAAKAQLGANRSMALTVTGHGGIPASGVSAVIVNITPVTPVAAGFVTSWAEGSARPGTSNVNFRLHQSTPNLAVVPVGLAGRIDLFNGSAHSLDLVVDVAGYIRSGTANVVGGAVSIAPARLFDSRSGVGVGPYPPYTTPPADGTIWAVGHSVAVPLKVTGRGGVPESGVSSVILNVTSINPTAPGNMSAYAMGSPIPNTSNLNYIVHQTVPNLVVAPVGPGGAINLLPASTGTAGLVVDVTGYVLAPQN